MTSVSSLPGTMLFRSISEEWNRNHDFDTSEDEDVPEMRVSPSKHCDNCRTPTPSPVPPFAQMMRKESPDNAGVICSPRCLKKYNFNHTKEERPYTDYSAHNYTQQHWQKKIQKDLEYMYN